jgi:Putative 2OG-Fe(II) oxygenase
MELVQTSLFQIPLWTAQLDEVVQYHEEMADEVEQIIDNVPVSESSSHLAHQTPSDPFHLPSKGWKILEQLCNDAYSGIAKGHFQRRRSGEFHLRRWAIRYGRLSEAEKLRLRKDSVHNHLPALFSSIYYLRLPPDFVECPDGGTLFVNPIGNLMDLLSPRTTTIAPKEGLLLVFPSFVDHTPVAIDWEAGEIPRIVVSSDVFYVSGEATTSGRTPAIKAGPAVAK